MISVDKIDKSFVPTVEWMYRRYDEMNQKLFNGSLGACKLKIFTTGKGSQGNTLGSFRMDARNLKYDSQNRMYKLTSFGNVYIDRSNFVELCNPTILINGNYHGVEIVFLNTLVHEMCHYYNYMEGIVPNSGHGREFYDIGEKVAIRSNGLFNIQRLASAEEMSQIELKDEIKAKNLKRELNKKSKMFAIFVYRKSGAIELTTTSNMKLIEHIKTKRNSPFVEKIVETNDPNFIDFLFMLGYSIDMRSYKVWQVAGEEWIGKVDALVNKKVYVKDSDMKESKSFKSCDDIINEVIERFVCEKEESYDITPDMDLGAYSPVELI